MRAWGPEQTAYLPGRRIEDAVLTTSLLPHVLLADNITGAIIFLDISKAFDTVDRQFLFKVMAVLGASDGMVAWTRLLLTGTTASTNVNGSKARPGSGTPG